MGDIWAVPFIEEGRPLLKPGEGVAAVYRTACPNYFHTMKIALLRGRDFSAQDTANSPDVVILNEELARKHWLGRDPIGHRISLDDRNENRHCQCAQTELAVRQALGAGRGAIARQMLVEGVVLASGGAVVGIALAWASLRLINTYTTAIVREVDPIRLDGTMFAVTLLVTCAVAGLIALPGC